jgi:hypothetical protein
LIFSPGFKNFFTIYLTDKKYSDKKFLGNSAIYWTSVRHVLKTIVGMLESKYALMKEKIILLFFLLSLSGMLIALTISFFFSWKILKK